MNIISRRPILFCLVGPAGSGKTSLAKKLLESPNSGLKKLVSATTRNPRPGEINGVNYHFLSRVEFEEAISKDNFFEWEEIHGNLYGQLKSSIAGSMSADNDIVLDIDIRGAGSIKKQYSADTVVIFLLPPSKDILKERITARAPITDKELARRMATAERELIRFQESYEKGNLIDYFLVNADFEDTLSGLSKIIAAEHQKLIRLRPEAVKQLIS